MLYLGNQRELVVQCHLCIIIKKPNYFTVGVLETSLSNNFNSVKNSDLHFVLKYFSSAYFLMKLLQ